MKDMWVGHGYWIKNISKLMFVITELENVSDQHTENLGPELLPLCIKFALDSCFGARFMKTMGIPYNMFYL